MSAHRKKLDLGFSTLHFFDDYVVGVFKEDVILDHVQVQALIKSCTSFYQNRFFVYISQRIYNYNVNPLIYFGLERIPNFCGIAVVSQKIPALSMAEFEKTFSQITFEIFFELEAAKDWAVQKIKKKKADL